MPDCVTGKHFSALQGHHNVAILLAVLTRPVLITFPLAKTNGDVSITASTITKQKTQFSATNLANNPSQFNFGNSMIPSNRHRHSYFQSDVKAIY